MESLDKRVLRRLRAIKSASVFSPKHFEDFGSRAAVDQALSRLVKAGRLRRVSRGLYDLPRKHPLLGTLSPNAELAAQSLVEKRGGRVQPSGAVAANLLGLSEQVPARVSYYTDLPSEKVKIGEIVVEFKHRSPRQMALARPTALVVSALRSLGKKHIKEERLDRLHQKMSARDRKQLLKDLPLAPAWMHPLIRRIATGKAAPGTGSHP